MKWEYLSAGLGLVAFGVAVALALPPPSRPDMWPIFVGLGVLAGSALETPEEKQKLIALSWRSEVREAKRCPQ
jgi:hypothetical protein